MHFTVRVDFRLLEMAGEANSDYMKQLLLGCLDSALSKLGLTHEYKGGNCLLIDSVALWLLITPWLCESLGTSWVVYPFQCTVVVS